MRITGFWLRHAATAASALAPLALVAPAQARPVIIALPATTLDAALLTLARESGLEIVSTERGLRQVRTPALSGPTEVRAALDRLLAGSGYRAVPIAGGFRIVAAPRSKAAAPRARPAPPEDHPELVVTASKQRILPSRYPGSLVTIDPSSARTAGLADSDAMLRVAPVVQGTALGPGRNKLFVRGIADSSFNGVTQSTATVYFGDVQLSYSGADPDLKLVDMERIEILEGPQGTLYGAGAIGGIVRLTPNAPDPSQMSADLSLGASATADGGPGYDVSGVVNLPITDRIALRAVGYRESDGGYIDNAQLGQSHVNRVTTTGGRAALRVAPDDGWTVDASALYQAIDTPDAQYTSGPVPLTRMAALAQPYSTSLGGARLVVAKRWASGLELVSATAWVENRTHSLFDATRGPDPLGYQDDEKNRLITHETRLSRSFAGGASWVVGLALMQDSNAQDRSLMGRGRPFEIIGVTNRARSASLFGEGTKRVAKDLFLTAGLRGTLARNDADPNFAPRDPNYVTGQVDRRVDPTLALTYTPSDTLAFYARYQSGFRSGGLAVARGIGRVASYSADEIQMGEIGARFTLRTRRPLMITASYSHAGWDKIQSDLIDRHGSPYTANIGTALIDTVEATASWQPIAGLTGKVSAVYTENVVQGPLANTSVRANRRLAQTPHFAASGALDYTWRAGSGRVRVGTTLSYTGRAVLGPGDQFDVSHPAYTILSAAVGWERGPLHLTLSGDNLINARSDRFPYGDPFLLYRRDVTTPLRPATVRLGMAYHW